MKLSEIMTDTVVRIRPEESVAVAARMLVRYNVGMLPVCGGDGRLYGVVTDRDMVTRCIAAGKEPTRTTVREVMTSNVVSRAVWARLCVRCLKTGMQRSSWDGSRSADCRCWKMEDCAAW